MRNLKGVELLCPTCGAADMARDASAKWNAAEGEWELSCTYDVMTCDVCGEETYECEELDLSTLPEEGADDWIELAKAGLAKPREQRSLREKYLAWRAAEGRYILKPMN